MIIVLDTNVIVSGLLSPYGPCGEIVRLVASGAVELAFDARIFAEYAAVLKRPKFGFAPELVETYLAQAESQGHAVAGAPLPLPLPDPDDEPFLAVALASSATCLVTGNAIHYPAARCQGVRVVAPRQFIDAYRKKRL